MGGPIRSRLLGIAVVAVIAASGCGSGGEEAAPSPTEPAVGNTLPFDAKAKEWTEGVAEDANGNLYVSISPQGRLVRFAPRSPEQHRDVAKIEGLKEGDLGLLGLTPDDDGNIYGCVVSGNPDANGVWRFDAGTGDATRLPGTEKIVFANDVIVDGDMIYVSDTRGPDDKGAVWRIPKDGEAELWAQDAMFAGTGAANFGFPLGPNGIDVYKDKIYLGLTEPAKILTIDIQDDGSAGDVSVFADLTKAGPAGKSALVDGIDVDDRDGGVFVATPIDHRVLRVSADGKDVSTVNAGPDLDGPASVQITGDALHIANFSGGIGDASNDKGPSVVVVRVLL